MYPTRIETVLFDLDGTLLDSAPDLAFAIDRLLLERGLPPAGIEAVRGWVGNGVRRLVARALTGREDGEPPAGEWQSAVERFFALYEARLFVDSRPYPGAVEGVRALAAAGYRVAVVTNKPRRFAEPLVRHLGLADVIRVVVGGECTAHRKPDPAPLLLALERLGADVDGALMVGDSATDVAAARAAGVPVVCVPYGYRRGVDVEQLGADGVVVALTELPARLQEAA